MTPGLVRLIELFAKIANAVEQAHRLGIVHRDLKPSNIRVDRWGEPHVLDFGLARLLEPGLGLASPVTVSGQVLGSLPWASPEHVACGENRVDARSDIYSLGVMLYQALTARFPYEISGSIADVARAISRTPPATPSRVSTVWGKRIDPALDAIVLKSLCKSAAGRHQSAASFGACLTDFALGKRTVGRSTRITRKGIALAVLGAEIVGLGLATIYVGNKPSAVLTQAPAIRLPSFFNSVGMKMVKIPRGSFLIGSPTNEPGRSADEAQRVVQIPRSFFIGSTLVTECQYASVMGQTSTGTLGKASAVLPVTGLSWYDAREFCRRLSAIETRSYRMPTEAEWEYACRADTTNAFATTSPLDDVAWYQANSGGHVHAVATKAPNGWGLYDMLGNVREWCSDTYPATVTVGPGQDNPDPHITRGGSAFDSASQCRAARRIWSQSNESWIGIGLRVVMDTPASTP